MSDYDYVGKCIICGKETVYLNLDTGIEKCEWCGDETNTGRTKEVIRKEIEELENRLSNK
jgi:ribosomal protein L37AE/L43A